jgi:hypothetical protein
MAVFAFFASLRFGRGGPIFPPMTTLSHNEKIAFAVCLGISATLILHMWCVHVRDGFLKKCFWSLILLVPVLGWVFYGGCYTPLSPRGDSPGPFFDGTAPRESDKPGGIRF